MCLTSPVKIKKVKGTTAELTDGRKISVALIAKPKAGDWVLTNADLAVSKVTEKEAKEIKSYFK